MAQLDHTHAVIATRTFYGPATRRDVLYVGTLAECREWVSDFDARVYRTQHNETGRPTLRLATRKSLSAHLATAAMDPTLRLA